MSESLRHLQSLHEVKLTESQKRKVRRLARAESLTAEQIASVLDLPADLVEAELVERERSIDPEAAWLRDTKTPIPSVDDFQRLYDEKDSDGLVMATLHLIRLENFKTPKYLREDCEMFALRKAIEAIDQLLSRDNPGCVRAYLKVIVKGALCDARTGRRVDARNSVSSAVRRVHPTPKATDKKRDALVADMRQRGLSDSMIEAELDSLGLKPRPQLVKPVGQWPVDEKRSKAQGETWLAEFGESIEPSVWEHIAEVLGQDSEEYEYLQLRAAGMTQEEIKDEFHVSIRDQQAIFESAQAKIQAAE